MGGLLGALFGKFGFLFVQGGAVARREFPTVTQTHQKIARRHAEQVEERGKKQDKFENERSGPTQYFDEEICDFSAKQSTTAHCRTAIHQRPTADVARFGIFEDREIKRMNQDRQQKYKRDRIENFRNEIMRFPIAFPKKRKTENQDRQDQCGGTEQAEKRVTDSVADATHQMRAGIIFEFVSKVAKQIQKKTNRKENANAEQDIGHGFMETVFF